MAKFTGKDQTVTFATESLTCITSVEYGDEVDMYTVECAGASAKTHIAGLSDISMTVNGILDQTDDDPLLAAIDPGDAGALDWYPAGETANYMHFDCANATVMSRTVSDPVNGFCSYSVEFKLDDILITFKAP